MVHCAVSGCRNHSGRNNNVHYYSIPRDKRRAEFFRRCMIADTFRANKAVVCSIHFDESDYRRDALHQVVRGPRGIPRLNDTAVPHLNLPEKLGDVSNAHESATTCNDNQNAVAALTSTLTSPSTVVADDTFASDFTFGQVVKIEPVACSAPQTALTSSFTQLQDFYNSLEFHYRQALALQLDEQERCIKRETKPLSKTARLERIIDILRLKNNELSSSELVDGAQVL